MISLEDIPEMLRELNSKGLTQQDFYLLCFDLFEHNDVDAVLALLPDKLRQDLVAELRSFCDNDIRPEDFVLFSSARGDHPAKLVIIDKIRSWLKLRPCGEPNSSGPTM